jgi:hypothetical protein
MHADDFYFVDNQHQQNCTSLLIHFGVNSDREYMTACYVLAHPEICRKVNWKACEYPFEFLKWRGNKSVDLSNGYMLLVQMAANLYNADNDKFNLMDALRVWDNNLLQVFYQAIQIRLGNVSLISN